MPDMHAQKMACSSQSLGEYRSFCVAAYREIVYTGLSYRAKYIEDELLYIISMTHRYCAVYAC